MQSMDIKWAPGGQAVFPRPREGSGFPELPGGPERGGLRCGARRRGRTSLPRIPQSAHCKPVRYCRTRRFPLTRFLQKAFTTQADKWPRRPAGLPSSGAIPSQDSPRLRILMLILGSTRTWAFSMKIQLTDKKVKYRFCRLSDLAGGKSMINHLILALALGDFFF